jgi:hypothetical protein
MYKFIDDVPLTAENIFRRVSQEEIFKIIFAEVRINKYFESPLRTDSEPGAWFDWWNNKLYFYDFADSNRNVRDCFGVIMDKFGMNYREAMNYVNDEFSLGLGTEKAVAPILTLPTTAGLSSNQKKTEIVFKSSKTFTKYHRKYFKSYGITRDNLVEDNIFSTEWFKFWSNKLEKWIRITPNIKECCYTINYWEDAKKVVRARYRGRNRFITNCSADHIGGNAFAGDLLIITKSWKDYRVLVNAGLTAVWLQNEGQIPEINKLMALCSTFKRVLVWFDNDETGVKASIKLQNIINQKTPGKAHTYHLPFRLLEDHKVKDPSDLRQHDLNHFKNIVSKIRLTHEKQLSSFVA